MLYLREVQQLTPAELKAWKAEEHRFHLVDVREPWERALFNIGGSHIPMGDLLRHIDEIPTDQPVVFYCERGIRSAIVIQRLEEKGFLNLFNLAGGMAAWKASASG